MSELDTFFGNLEPLQKRAVDDERLFRALMMDRLNKLNGRVDRNEELVDQHDKEIAVIKERQTLSGLLSTAAGAVTGFFTALFSK